MPDEQMAAAPEPEMDATFAETGEAEVMDEGGERRRRELAQNLEDDDEQEKDDAAASEQTVDEAAQDAGDVEPEAQATPHMSMRDIVRAAAVVSAKKESPAAAKAAKAEQPTASDKVMAELDQNMREAVGVDTGAASAGEPEKKKGARTPNNSIDKAYLSGSVSAIGCPCVLPGGGKAIIMMGTPVVCTDGSYAVMGAGGVQPMNLAGADGANNGDCLRNAFMLGFMSGMQGNGFMNGFMRSLGTQLGMAGLSALRGETGAAKHAQASVALETGELSDLARPKDTDARVNVDLNGDGVANDEQQRANAEANADEDGTEKDERAERREREARVAARRLPNVSLMGHAQGASAGLDMGA